MSEIICRSISNGREFEIHTDPFSSLHALRAECNSYIPAEARYTELLAEHDKQVIKDFMEFQTNKHGVQFPESMIDYIVNTYFDERQVDYSE